MIITALMLSLSERQFINEVLNNVRSGREATYASVNTTMIDTYWRIGQRIVKEEQRDLAHACAKSYLE